MSKFLILAAFALAAPAAAQTSSTAVTIADLNLASAPGVAALDARLDRAARRVCGIDGATALWAKRSATACYRAALDGVAAPRQAAVAAARGDTRLAMVR